MWEFCIEMSIITRPVILLSCVHILLHSNSVTPNNGGHRRGLHCFSLLLLRIAPSNVFSKMFCGFMIHDPYMMKSRAAQCVISAMTLQHAQKSHLRKCNVSKRTKTLHITAFSAAWYKRKTHIVLIVHNLIYKKRLISHNLVWFKGSWMHRSLFFVSNVQAAWTLNPSCSLSICPRKQDLLWLFDRMHSPAKSSWSS